MYSETDDEAVPSIDLEGFLPLNPGEHIVLRVNNVSLLLRSSESQTALGVLFITNFQLLHISNSSLPGSICVKNNYIISVPVMAINQYQKKTVEGQGNRQIKLYTKDMRCVKITYNKTKATSGIIKYLHAFNPLVNTEDLFAFRYQPSGIITGWNLYDPVKEHKRMGVHLPFKQFDTEARQSTPIKEIPTLSINSSPPKKKPTTKPSYINMIWGKKKDKSTPNSPKPNSHKQKQEETSSDTDNYLAISPRSKRSQSDRALRSPTRRASTDDLCITQTTSNLELKKHPILRNISETDTRRRVSRYTLSDMDSSMPMRNDSAPDLSTILGETKSPAKEETAKWTRIGTPGAVTRNRSLQVGRRNLAATSCFPVDLPKPVGRIRRSISSPSIRQLANHRIGKPRIPLPPPLPAPSTPIWLLTDVNKNFAYSPTYPRYFCVPSQVKFEELEGCFAFRSKGRIPVLTWKRRLSTSSLLRSSQPLVGMGGSYSTGDEQYLKYVLALNSKCKRLRIIDARGKNAANANHARGAGYEGSRYTQNCSISFMGIENIHTMRESLNKVFDILKKRDDGYWCTALEGTGWLRHIRLIMQAARVVVDYIEDGDSVLVHCSDGWDRTSQICGLAELALDPYYRTIEGFLILIEKEWIQYGHKFGERSGHTPNVGKSETSPVFLQWLDCVHQLLEQYPCSFEFNKSLLVYLIDEVFACRFGTFLANSMQEQEELRLPTRTASLWGDILNNRQKFTNVLFAENPNVLMFSCSSRTLRFWKEFFLRWDGQCTVHEDAEAKLKYILQEMERRQDKLKSMHNLLEEQLEQSRRGQLLTIAPSRRRLSSMLALQHVTTTSNIELAMKELVDEIIENACVTIKNKNKNFGSAYDTEGENNSQGTVQRPWIPEHWAKACHKCNRKFSQFRRKHHCRNCGQVYCKKCCKYKSTLPKYSIYEPVRVCDDCFPIIREEHRSFILGTNSE